MKRTAVKSIKNSRAEKEFQAYVAAGISGGISCILVLAILVLGIPGAETNTARMSSGNSENSQRQTFSSAVPSRQKQPKGNLPSPGPSEAQEVIAASFEEKESPGSSSDAPSETSDPAEGTSLVPGNLESAPDTPVPDDRPPTSTPDTPAPDDRPLTLGRIEELVAHSYIEILQNEDATLRAIDGNFSSIPITNNDDALRVMNQVAPVLGAPSLSGILEAEQSTVSGGASESYYRLSQEIEGIAVVGSEILLTVDENQRASGLFSAYDSNIDAVDTQTSSNIDNPEEVRATVVASLLKNKPEDVSPEDPGIVAVLDALEIESSLVILSSSLVEEPSLVWQVRATTNYEGLLQDEAQTDDTPVGEDGAGVNEENAADSEADIEANGEAVQYSALPSIANSYYIRANGADAGAIVYENTGNGVASVTDTATDLKGETRTIRVENEDGIYRMRDSKRNIKTYNAQEKLTINFNQLPNFGYVVPVLPGTLVEKGQSGWDAKAVSVHANMAKVYDYYADVLGRSIFEVNGTATAIIISIGITPMHWFWESPPANDNAFWDEEQFRFYDGGYEAALDVCGHEYTHAVIDSVVGNSEQRQEEGQKGFIYQGETGALEESYADILGTLIEGKTTEGRWQIAEDGGEDALRSFVNPGTHKQPFHYRDFGDSRYGDASGTDITSDYGGVHAWGGIFNHAAYQMMTDERCGSISPETWAKVFYRSLSRLGIDAKFLDARVALISTAKQLDFARQQLQAMRDAFDAVGIVEHDSLRIVLRWGATPDDLDSHLTGPRENGDERFHTYFASRSHEVATEGDGTVSAADLDYDDTSSYGPEITTIRSLTSGEYYFSVHNYSNRSSGYSTVLGASGATVTVYRGTSSVPLKLADGVTDAVFTVDTARSGTLWRVFRLVVTQSGRYTLAPLNEYDYQQDVRSIR